MLIISTFHHGSDLEIIGTIPLLLFNCKLYLCMWDLKYTVGGLPNLKGSIDF